MPVPSSSWPTTRRMLSLVAEHSCCATVESLTDRSRAASTWLPEGVDPTFNTEGSLTKSMRAALGLCTTTVVLATVLPGSFSSGAVGASGKVLTDVEIGTMAPAAQAALLDPQRAIAGALSNVGKGSGAHGFTSVGIDANHDVVNLYLTDTRRAAGVIQEAKSTEPSIDTNLIRVRKATYTLAALDVARTAFLVKPHPCAVYAVSPAPDGSGLQIEVDNTTTAIKTWHRCRQQANRCSHAECEPRRVHGIHGGSVVHQGIGTTREKRRLEHRQVARQLTVHRR